MHKMSRISIKGYKEFCKRVVKFAREKPFVQGRKEGPGYLDEYSVQDRQNEGAHQPLQEVG